MREKYADSRYHKKSEKDSTAKILTKKKIETKITITNFYVISILEYDIECWKFLQIKRKLEATDS